MLKANIAHAMDNRVDHLSVGTCIHINIRLVVNGGRIRAFFKVPFLNRKSVCQNIENFSFVFELFLYWRDDEFLIPRVYAALLRVGKVLGMK